MENNAKSFEELIKQRTANITPIVFAETDSTNRVAKELALQGAPEGTAVLALKQSGGKGRLGRSFFSPEGGIYLSLILRPTLSPEISLFITTAAAVAAAEAIEELFGKPTLIKWVNDIYIYNRKVCGILTEGGIDPQNGRLKFVVLGIGINVSPPKVGFPAYIADIAGAICESTVALEKKAELVGLFCDNFLTHYNNIEEKAFLQQYRSRSMLTGKIVSFEKDGITHIGEVLGIDNDARLLIEENGHRIALGAGDVSVKWR